MRYCKKRRNYCRTLQKRNNNKSKARKSKMLTHKKKKFRNPQGNRRLKKLAKLKTWLLNIFKSDIVIIIILANKFMQRI